MKAIILAAGIGRRLGEANPGNLPKCLLGFGGKTLIQRHLEILAANGVTDITLVLGHEAELIQQEISRAMPDSQPEIVLNPDYTHGSGLSLRAASSVLRSGHDIILMDADVLYSPEMIRRLVETDKPDCFLLDGHFEPGPEPVKLCVRNGQLVEFRKQLPAGLRYDTWGESVGFFRFSAKVASLLADRLDSYFRQGRLDEPHEEAIRDLLLEQPDVFDYEDVSGLPWIEIDFPEDVSRAEQEILPRI